MTDTFRIGNRPYGHMLPTDSIGYGEIVTISFGRDDIHDADPGPWKVAAAFAGVDLEGPAVWYDLKHVFDDRVRKWVPREWIRPIKG